MVKYSSVYVLHGAQQLCKRILVQGIPEVTECYNISGSFDYLLKIHAPNMKYYQEFILNVLGTVESLGSLESIFVMDEVKHDYGIHF